MTTDLNKFSEAPNFSFDSGIKIPGSNRRKESRTPCLIPVQYKINRQFYSSFILDINQAGAFIETDRLFPSGEKIVVKFLDPYSRRPSLINGSIAWSNDDAMGVKFNYHLFALF